ncbi:MAG: hypothetical protein IJ730_05350 [Alphaproteobacteria bacterium]|nr:hypothetical protein [Alphaproteobacteria bacterium]
MKKIIKLSVFAIIFMNCTSNVVIASQVDFVQKHPVYDYVKLQANACYDKKEVSSFETLNSGKVSYNTLFSWINACGFFIVNSIFSNNSIFQDVFSKINGENIKSQMKEGGELLQTVNKTASNPLSEDDLQRLSLIVPGKATLSGCVKNFEKLFGDNDNYDMTKEYPSYTLENALFVLFLRRDRSIFDCFTKEKEKKEYVHFFCGAVRKYLAEICGVSIKSSPNCSSYSLILSTCYNYFNRKKYN